jgi:hypothetical protein
MCTTRRSWSIVIWEIDFRLIVVTLIGYHDSPQNVTLPDDNSQKSPGLHWKHLGVFLLSFKMPYAGSFGPIVIT